MKNFINFLLVCLAMLVGVSVSFAKPPEIKKLHQKDYGFSVLDLSLNDVEFQHVTFALPPECWQSFDVKVIHNTPYLLKKCYLNSCPVGKSSNSKQFVFARGFDL